MSLEKAKKMAELREEIAEASKGLSAFHQDSRKKMDADILSGFTDYLEANNFAVSKSKLGAQGEYKDLKIKLVLAGPEDEFIGIYHSFEIWVNDKKKDVTIKPIFSGIPSRSPIRSGDSIQMLEEDLHFIKEELANRRLTDFKFDCTQRPIRQGIQPVLKDSVAEVVDYFLS